ncbi:unnamed protein product, partial [Ectocarpus sp. 12 AP-2014]
GSRCADRDRKAEERHRDLPSLRRPNTGAHRVDADPLVHIDLERFGAPEALEVRVCSLAHDAPGEAARAKE